MNSFSFSFQKPARPIFEFFILILVVAAVSLRLRSNSRVLVWACFSVLLVATAPTTTSSVLARALVMGSLSG